MPAYKLPLETQCVWDRYGRCPKRATHTVYNTWNEPRGTYCTQHATQLVQELNAPVRTMTAEEAATLRRGKEN